MALFDCLIVEDGIAKVIDLGHGSFAQFFRVVEEIGFIDEACRRAIEPVILFAAKFATRSRSRPMPTCCGVFPRPWWRRYSTRRS